MKRCLTILLVLGSFSCLANGSIRLFLGEFGNKESKTEKTVSVTNIQESEVLKVANASCEFDFSLLEEELSLNPSHITISMNLDVDGGQSSAGGEAAVSGGMFQLISSGYWCFAQVDL